MADLPHSYIRDEFVVAYIRRREAGWELRWKLIAERDAKGREINKAFGITEPDGSTSPYSRSYAPDYKTRFAAMEAEFQPRYDAVTTDEIAADRADGMTIWEYLLLEEIQDTQLYLDAAASGQYVNWVALKGKDEIEKIRHHTLGEMQRLIEIKKGLFPYAAKRCRTVLRIGAFDFPAQAAIMKFGSELHREMPRYLSGLRLT